MLMKKFGLIPDQITYEMNKAATSINCLRGKTFPADLSVIILHETFQEVWL